MLANYYMTMIMHVAAYANYVETLPEFIAHQCHHVVEKLCLPCKLVLPVGEFRNPLAQSKLDALKRNSDIQRKPLKEKEAMDTQRTIIQQRQF